MKDLLDKLGSYNLFNYLLPGLLFAVMVDQWTSFKIAPGNLAIGVFVYFFLGSVISRLGGTPVDLRVFVAPREGTISAQNSSRRPASNVMPLVSTLNSTAC